MYSTNLQQGIVFSSELNELIFTFQINDSDYLNHADIYVISDHGPVIFSSRLFFKGNSASIYNFRSLVEENLFSLGESYDRLEIEVSVNDAQQQSTFVDVIYCNEFALIKDREYFLRSNFLSYAVNSRIPRAGFSYFLELYAVKDEPIEYKISAIYRDEYQKQVNIDFYSTKNVAPSDGLYSIEVGYEIVNNLIAERLAGHQFELLAFSVFAGERCASFFIDVDLKQKDAYMFKNKFNISEIVFIPAQIKCKSDLELSSAIVAGKKMQYDLKPSRTFEVESGPLTVEEAERAELFLMSAKKYKAIVYDDYSVEWTEILVSDIKCDIDLKPDEPPAISFSWLPTDSRPLAVFSDSVNTRIFAKQFNPIFN
ncbi:MAG: hypothetical protein K2M31_07835 [Muribaculaceae bacterium]|nr:hypothetical protein [Muribaculaceae bacterium]